MIFSGGLRFTLLVLDIILSTDASAQRPVCPLIVDGIARNGAKADTDAAGKNDQPGDLFLHKLLENNESRVTFQLALNSQFVKTTGTPTYCRQHMDCYALREPDEWCLSGTNDISYFDKGCFCDPGRNLCSIERRSPSGLEYTDCTEKAISECNADGNSGMGPADNSGTSTVVPAVPRVLQPVTSNADNRISDNLNAQIIIQKSKLVDESQGIFQLSPQAVYVKTSAQTRFCNGHDDCYSMREPDEWCPMPLSDKYHEKGCFCNPWNQRCFIERQTTHGIEYSDCADKSVSKCQTFVGSEDKDIQKFIPDQSDSTAPSSVGWLTVSPRGQYVLTSGRPKPCIQQQDCYEMREPNEWCPLPTYDRYYDKGCFCDYARNVCAIEREALDGSEYTDCAEKSTSTCQHS